MIANLASFRRIAITRPDLRAASVAVCVLLRQDVPCLLITRRAAGLRNHAGQWALPGGSRPPGESVEEAALRELREETGMVAEAGLGEVGPGHHESAGPGWRGDDRASGHRR